MVSVRILDDTYHCCKVSWVYQSLCFLPRSTLYLLLFFPSTLLLKGNVLDVFVGLTVLLMRLEGASVAEVPRTPKALQNHHKEENFK